MSELYSQPDDSHCKQPAFHEFFQTYRKARGLSVNDLACYSGLHANNLYAFEKGKRGLSDLDMHRLASVPQLGLTYEELRLRNMIESMTQEQVESLYQHLKSVVIAGATTSPRPHVARQRQVS